MNWPLLSNSLLVSGLTTILAGGTGFIAALGSVVAREQGRRGLMMAAVVALVLPPFLVVNTWLDLLGGNGVLHRWWPLDLYSLGGAVWLLTLLTWPITTLLVVGAWSRLERSQLESDAALSGTALIRWLLWPMARTAVAQAAVLTFVLALNNFAIPVILQVPVFPEELWLAFTTRLNDTGAWAAAWPLVVVPESFSLAAARRRLRGRGRKAQWRPKRCGANSDRAGAGRAGLRLRRWWRSRWFCRWHSSFSAPHLARVAQSLARRS
jgi:ABC-type Fe3+ transport system permease subunit